MSWLDATWPLSPTARELARRALLVGIAGAVVLAVAALFDVRAVLQVYLAAAIGWTAVPIGCLPLLMMMHLIGGVWRREVAAPFLAACRTLPVAAVLFLPVLLGIGQLYPWTHGASPEWTGFKTVYLSEWCFILRTILYFVIWITFAVVLTRSAQPRRGVASAGLIVYAITASLAGIDWAMSLEPEFASSIYGLIFLTHQLLAGLAAAIAARVFLSPRPCRTIGLGALLLSVVLLWMYLHAMQYIIIWSGDLPREITWYIERAEGGWGLVIWALGLLQGAAPFVACLSARWRSSPAVLGGMALTILAMRLLESFWLTLPAMPLSSPWLTLVLAIAAVAAVGGLWGAVFLRCLLPGAPLLLPAKEARYG
jgi:hypothetical protein